MPDPKEPVPQECGILTIMTPGETGGMEIEINLSPEGACPAELREGFYNKTKKRLLSEPLFNYKLITYLLR